MTVPYREYDKTYKEVLLIGLNDLCEQIITIMDIIMDIVMVTNLDIITSVSATSARGRACQEVPLPRQQGVSSVKTS